jgi:hypothetical protein
MPTTAIRWLAISSVLLATACDDPTSVDGRDASTGLDGGPPDARAEPDAGFDAHVAPGTVVCRAESEAPVAPGTCATVERTSEGPPTGELEVRVGATRRLQCHAGNDRSPIAGVSCP